MRLLTRSDVERCLPMDEAIAAMAEAFGQIASGKAIVPPRIGIPTPDGTSLFMPARLSGSRALGLKIVSVRDGNAARGLPSVLGLVALLDDETGTPLALMDGTSLTAIRTAATSALATRYLARRDASVVAFLGAGAQARAHLRALREVRPIEEIRIAGGTGRSAQQWAMELRAAGEREIKVVATAGEAVRGADIVCCCTNSAVPVFEGADLKAGAHVNAIGAYTATSRETDDATVRRATRIVVDARSTLAQEAGDLAIPLQNGLITEASIAELGELVLGTKEGRRASDDVTLFKSVGNAAQDVAAARSVLRRGEKLGLGRLVDLAA